MKDVIIIGGGLAGLVNSILLKRAGLDVLLFEEKKYPFHRVCGEYISNEVVPFLKENGLFPDDLNSAAITKFHLTSTTGKSLRMPLDLGGFGVSRKSFDFWLAEKAIHEGVEIIHERIVESAYEGDHLKLTDKNEKNFSARIVIGAIGKRSKLDKSLDRKFIQKSHPFIGVKYHIKTDVVDSDIVELHNFWRGYCGVNQVEGEVHNLCYLSHRDNLKKHGSIEKMEENVLKKNPHLKRIFENADFVFDKPEVINEITFEKKEPVFEHILMSGDSAGMITPLCGNGMAMAIHSAKILSELVIERFNGNFNRQKLEQDYTNLWNSHFAKRHWTGRKIQALFGSPFTSDLAVMLGNFFPPFAKTLMKKTHGEIF